MSTILTNDVEVGRPTQYCSPVGRRGSDCAADDLQVFYVSDLGGGEGVAVVGWSRGKDSDFCMRCGEGLVDCVVQPGDIEVWG